MTTKSPACLRRWMNHSPSSPKHHSKLRKELNKALRDSCEPYFAGVALDVSRPTPIVMRQPNMLNQMKDTTGAGFTVLK